MKQSQLILPVLLLFLIIACESPSDSFERTNKNDPISPNFAGGTVTGLSAVADSSGLITLRWPSADNSVDKHVIEKSLGDSLSFSPIAELEPDETTFIDDSHDVRLDTYYRLSSYMEVNGIGDVLYGTTGIKLEFGSISNIEYEFLRDSNQLKLTWSTDVPFFTHFIISSDRVISDQQESTVKIPALTNKHSFQDPLLDVDFEARSYTITGVIENNGVDETVAEKEFVFNPASFFKPQNVQINILNEQDWQVTWENKAFFSTDVELVRLTSADDVDINLPSDAESYTDSMLLDDTRYSQINLMRRYSLRFLSGNSKSEPVVVDDFIVLDRPLIAISNTPQTDPNSLTIYGSGFGEDRELIKQYIIEKPHPFLPDRFVEVGRADGGRNFQFTDNDVRESESPVYRVRTLTSIPSKTMTFAFSHDYDLDYEFDTGLNYITAMELSSDNRYMAYSTFWEDRGNSVLIYDLTNQQTIGEIIIPNQEITDIKISIDDQSIYLAVPTEQAIYKADFPDGGNIQKVIDDAVVNSTPVLNITLSPDNSFVLGTGGLGFVKRWDLVTLTPEFIFDRFNTPTIYPYKNVAISPDGQSILANNGKALLLDASDGSILDELPSVDDYVLDHQYSSDGRYMAFVSGFRYPHIFETENLNRTVLSGKGHRADFHPTKNELLIASRGSVYTFDVETMSVLDVVSSSNGDGAYHRTENKLMYIDDEQLATVSGQSVIQIWKKSGSQRRWKNVIYN